MEPVKTSDHKNTSIKTSWKPVEGAESYVIKVREFPNPWEEAKTHTVSAADIEDGSYTVTGLFPTSTY